jgi:hypothetical protein
MVTYAVAELDDGLTVLEVMPDQSPEDAAVSAGGVLVDPGPYSTLEDASNAIDLLEPDNRDDL